MLQIDPPTGGSIRLAVAERPFLRLLGLGGLPALEPYGGLLIPRCRAVHTIGMRFPIDVVFALVGGDPGAVLVLAVRDAVRPLRFVSAGFGRGIAAIEIASGEAARHGIAVGGRLGLDASVA